MKTCWDEASDARITSHCVEQRIKKIIYSPSDNTFDAILLDQLKDCSNEVSTDSTSGYWDDASSTNTKKNCSSVSSLNSVPSKSESLDYTYSFTSPRLEEDGAS